MTGLPKSAAKHDATAVFVDEVTEQVILVPCDEESSDSHEAHMYMDIVAGLYIHILSDMVVGNHEPHQ